MQTCKQNIFFRLDNITIKINIQPRII